MEKLSYKFHEFYMNIAIETAKLSYSQRSKVGCVVVKNKNILSYGYNGTPVGFNNKCEDESGNTLPIVVHAECNSLAKICSGTESSEGATMYCTLSPCFDCSKQIIQAKIKEVIYLE